MKAFGKVLLEEELEELINSIDKDGNQLIDFEEFVELITPYVLPITQENHSKSE